MGQEIPKTYEPKEVEEKIYDLWEKGEFFSPRGKGKPFVIAIPPPNITGSLHMGHALDETVQDVMIRYNRMKQVPTLWIPGTDHAGIATQNKIEKELKKQGLSRHDLGREKFIEKVWEWKEKYGSIILDQLRKLGCSCDWSRLRFTMDENYAKAVETAFLHYHERGWIYKGPRIVNWCPRCGTAISDIEIRYTPHKTKLWYIKYEIKSQKSKVKSYIIVATTRPETMLGDTAVAVNPKDERYKKMIDGKIILPLMNREIPIIADRLIDLEFGTGAVKITPAHDAVDNKIGKTHKLETINVIGEDGKITEHGGNYAGLKILDARNKIIEDLKNLNLMEKEEDYEHSLAICDRCETPIEPLISKQWFLKMDELAKPAIKAVKSGKIKFAPERYKKTYLDWLNNIEDWCISRQLWWGHKIPIAGEHDVLDTWFSSALWPFATLGWPFDYAQGKPRKNSDLEKFYPTSLLVTAQDIIYLWVARMVFSSLEFLKTIPFKDVYIHATILDKEGKRMSKSLGTGIDPLELIEKYGADATRFGLLYQTSRNQQAVKFSEDTIRANRNFCNKLWNINRFITMNRQNTDSKMQIPSPKDQTPADKEILKRLNEVIKSITKKIENYELGESARELYEFVWHEYADKYIEKSKIQNPKSKIDLNPYIFSTILKLLHPFMPFITEYLWQMNYKEEKPLIISEWPKIKK